MYIMQPIYMYFLKLSVYTLYIFLNFWKEKQLVLPSFDDTI